MSFKTTFAGAALLATLALSSSAWSAPLQTAAPAAVPLAPQAHALTKDDLDAWLDGFIPYAMERADMAGIVIVVVKDGRILTSRGFGVADVKTRRPVDPKTTLFRPGSVSKLFTWTAVMQLVERGKLDLDKDVNTYLDFKIPEAYGKPITLRNLMTHTPGFEETIKGLFAKDHRPLDTVLKAWVPTRIFPPGEVSAYSNYGAALAGYIVQRVSGEPFEQYIAHHIFQPLGMTHATFEQPLPKILAADMSKGYQAASGKELEFENVNMSPAGALSASGEDMARFMIAHLNNGTYQGAQILKPETAVLMHGNAYRPVAQLPAMALGFYHQDRNGHVVIAHGGDTVAFHSNLQLILDQNVGLFYSQNSLGKAGMGIRVALFDRFMDRYFPAPALPDEKTIKSAKVDAAKIAGTYEVSRRSETNFLIVGDVLGQITFTANDDGTISTDFEKDLAGNPKKWREVAPNIWREVNGSRIIVVTLKDGKIARMDTDDFPPIWVVSPAPFWYSSAWNIPLLITTMAMLALVVLFWPLKAVLRWRYASSFPLSGRGATLYRLSRIEALLALLFLGGWGVFAALASETPQLLDSPSDIYLRGLQLIGVVAVIGAIVPLYQLTVSLPDATRPWWTKVSDLLLALACLATVWFAFSMHFLSLTLNY
jgi:CubicO group peptidase (beta-lactamase class C family)